MAKNEANDGPPPGGGVAESVGNTDIDMLLAASSQSDAPLHRFKDSFALLMVDVVGSPAFFERYGETAILVMLQQHNELVVPVVHESGGTVVRSVGDTALALFDSAAKAARAAVRIQQRVDEYDRARKPNERFHCRIALGHSAGPAVDPKVFESVVNEVGRIGKACQGGQVLLSGVMKEALQGTQSLQLRKASFAGKKSVKGLKDIYEIVWTPELKTSAIVNPAEERAAAGSGTPAAEPEKKDKANKLGRYEILEEIGVGGMGVVYKANDPMVGRTIAIKTVRLDSKGKEREELVRRLRLEAHAAGRLEHPAIVTIYDAGEAEGIFYLAMQYVEGRPLSASLAERMLMPVKQILTMMEEISDGLYYAHKREIVHRDLKPANIVVTPEGKPKILDFGIAKISDTGMTKAGTILGTPNYMSPEQASGRRIDRRSDIFSLGAILYELLTGERAFAGSAPTAVLHKIREENPIPLRKIDPTIEPALENVVNKALAKDPFQRYQTCAELRDDLAAVRTGQVSTPVPQQQPGPYMGATVVMTPAPDSQPPMVGTPIPATPTPPPTGMGLSPAAGSAADAPPVTPRSPVPGTVPPVPRTHGAGVAPPKKSSSVVRVMFLLFLLSVIGAGVGVNQGLISPEQLEFLGPALPYVQPLFPADRQGTPPPQQQGTPGVITAGEGDPTPDTPPVATGQKETTAGNADKPAQAGVTLPGGTDTPATSTKTGGAKTGSADNAGRTTDTAVPKTPEQDAGPKTVTPKTVTEEPPKTTEKKTPPRRTRSVPRLTEQEQARIKILLGQARNFMNQNRLDFAERRLQSALRIDPNNQEAQKMLADIRQRRRLPPR